MPILLTREEWNINEYSPETFEKTEASPDLTETIIVN